MMLSSFLAMSAHQKRVDMAVEEMKLLYKNWQQGAITEKDFLFHLEGLIVDLAFDIHTTEFAYYTGVKKLVGEILDM